jgi:CBS domain-containing protein
MTPSPETIVEETPLDEIVTVMEQKRIKRLPVCVQLRKVKGDGCARHYPF